MFVVDASVAIAWCFDDEANVYTESIRSLLQREQAIVPIIWRLEVANVLLVAERRRRITEAQSLHYIEMFDALPISVDDDGLAEVFGRAMSIGRERGLSVYDATYLELAARLGLPLATQDKRLRSAASDVGIMTLS